MLISFSPFLFGQAPQATPAPDVAWAPQLVSVRWVKAEVNAQAGPLIMQESNSGELYLEVSLTFEKGPGGMNGSMPPTIYLIEGTVEEPYSCCPEKGSVPYTWRYVRADDMSQAGINCIELIAAHRQARQTFENMRSVYSPSLCAGKQLSFYFRLPESVKNPSLIFQDDSTLKKQAPAPLKPAALGPALPGLFLVE